MAQGCAKQSATLLMQAINSSLCRCPAHSNVYWRTTQSAATNIGNTTTTKEYAYEMTTANVRFGDGVTQEVGMDFLNLGIKRLCVMTDKNLVRLPAVKSALDSLHKHRINYSLYDRVRTEPSDASFKDAIQFALDGNFDAYLAVGGGSVIDTCKAANLYASNPKADFLDYVNAPVGKGFPVTHAVRPLIAVPTTSGTGSETSGVAIFEYEPLNAKTGIASRRLKPSLGLIDSQHTHTMPERVLVNSGFDVLCHALEAYTAIPFSERTPRPMNPSDRPMYQGSNPISDVWATHSLRMIDKHFIRAVKDRDNHESLAAMHFASTCAGFGIGNAGVHLCHGMAYAIAGNVKHYFCKDYNSDHPMVPHGLAVVLTAPAVFQFTSAMCPERHLQAAELLGADVSGVKLSDAGRLLADTVRRYMYELGVDNGLKALGYTNSDIPALVQGTLPQKRVTQLSPRPQTEADLTKLLEDSMTVY